MQPEWTYRVNHSARLMLETAKLVAATPSPEAERIGVYVLAAIVGLLVCGLVSVARELRAEGRS